MMKETADKKGLEMSMNLIVIAVIVLIILVVVILIFSGAAKKFVFGTSSGLCGDKRGSLMKITDPSHPPSCPTGQSHYLPGDTADSICCISEGSVLG
jgi:hypothetical protein